MRTKILIVDDEEEIRQLMCYHFEQEGYDVESAAGGDEALKRVIETHFSLVISDIRMPEGDGFTLLKNISSLCLKKTKVILMSGFSHISPEEAEKEGALKLFRKPLNLTELASFIKSAIGH